MTLSVNIFVAVALLTAGSVFPSQPTTRPSDLPPGQPSWLPLGGQVYQETSVTEGEKQVLSFDQQARWFLPYQHEVSKETFDAYLAKLRAKGTFQLQQNRDGTYWLPDRLPYPTSVASIPEDDRGVRLSLKISPIDNSVLSFELRLSSSTRPVWREVEHRATDTIPFLFAFFVDGKAVEIQTRSFGKNGGSQHSIELIPPGGGERQWSLQVDAATMRKLLSNDMAHTLAVVAAFSERQRMGFLGVERLEDDQFWQSTFFQPPMGHKGPQILVRSNVAEVRWTGEGWLRAGAKQ